MNSGPDRFRDPRAPVDARVADLLGRLSLEEKVGQLTARPLPSDGRLAAHELAAPPGVVLAQPDHWQVTATRVEALQEQLGGAGPLGIPALVITLRSFAGAVRFPRPIARAAAWDQGLMEDIAAASAFEARAGGAAARLGPVVAPAVGPLPVAPADRDQCLGGDPVLAAELVAAHVRGAQGAVPGRIRPDGAAVIITHVGAIASQLAGLPTHAHERTMRSVVLVPAEAAVLAGAALAVPLSAANAGVPGHADSWLLRDVLRCEWGFRGVVLAAFGAVAGLVDSHRVTGDLDTAHALALEAGVDVVDVDRTAPGSSDRMVRLVRNGAVPSWVVDEAVSALLRLKFELGLFENPGPLPSQDRVGGRTHRDLAHRAGTESLVLIADGDAVLPLSTVGPIDVLCADPGAGTVPDTGTLARALGAALPSSTVRDLGPSTAADATDLAGTVLAVVPADPRAADIVISRIVATGRRCVALVCSGDVDAAPALASTRAAVLLCWQPIRDQDHAVVDVLTGVAEPGGRLPFALGDGSRFPLGHGGGYTTFQYSQLQIAPTRASGAEPVLVQFRVTNAGTRPGKEVAQVYLHDRISSVRRAPRMLVGFAPVRLEPGRSRQVRIRIAPARLAVWDRTMRRVVEPGEFDVLVGASANDIRLTGTFVASTGGDAPLPRPARG